MADGINSYALSMGMAISSSHKKFMNKRLLKDFCFYVFAMVAFALAYLALDFDLQALVPSDAMRDVVAASIGVLGFPTLKTLFERLTRRFFFVGVYDFSRALGDFNENLRTLFEPGAILSAVADLSSCVLGVRRISFWFDDGRSVEFCGGDFVLPRENPEHEAHVDIIREFRKIGLSSFFVSRWPGFWLRGERGVSGQDFLMESMVARKIGGAMEISPKGGINMVVLFGSKVDGSPFDSTDKKLLTIALYQAATLLRNAELYENVNRNKEELERLVDERTKRITEMHKAQSDFLADLSHEFQTPLAILVGNVEALKEGRASSSSNAFYVMETTLARLSRLVSGLLDAARFRFADPAEIHRSTSLKKVIEGAFEDCRVLAEEKEIAFSVRVDHLAVSVSGDRLKEVLLNLVSNAFRHTHCGGSVTILGRRVDQEAEIVVADTGSGIAARDLAHIFDRFYRIEGARERGTGLGLHICRQILESMGGTIVAESTVGVGSRFVVRLPIGE